MSSLMYSIAIPQALNIYFCCSCAFIIQFKFESYTHWSLDELLSQAQDGLISVVVLHRDL